jgi:hypothetical protein
MSEGLESGRSTLRLGNRLATAGIVVAIWCAAAIGFVSIDKFVFTPYGQRQHEIHSRDQCGLDMQSIGRCLFAYAQENHGAFPPDLGTLVQFGDMKADEFICTNLDLEPPSNMTNAQAAAWVDQNSTYVYAGAGLTTKCPPSTILLYEKDANHDGNGMNILFADLSWRFYSLPEAHKIIEEQTAGK